jgi:hypothetical protein
MVALKKMVATVDLGSGTAQKYYFMSNPALYSSIGTIVGISESPASDTKVIHRVEDLLLYGVLVKKVARVGTSLNKRSVKLFCAANKSTTAEQDLIGKVIPQGTISSISADLKAQDYLA